MKDFFLMVALPMIAASACVWLGFVIGSAPDTTDEEQVDEELAKLERDVEFLELKIKSKQLENELKGWG